MRPFRLLYTALLLLACGGNTPQASVAPARDGELSWAKDAYAAYCGLRPRSGACCLKEADFEATNWSAVSGRYLHALREHYECMRGDALIDSSLDADPNERPALGLHLAPVEETMSYSCEKHACMGSGEVMAAQLDRALLSPVRHAKDALIACAP